MDNAAHHFVFVAHPDSAARRRTRLPASRVRPVRRRTYSVPEVAVILGIGRSTAYALVQRGELAALRVGGRVVIARAEINRLLGEDPAA
jgi:excisionase family DNA binding protein